jgi:hypothetical protein
MMPELPMAHTMRRTPGKLVKPAVDFFKRLTQKLDRIGAMLFKGGHWIFLALTISRSRL